MDITEIRVKRLKGRSDRLRAFCSITLDGEFVVHDLRVIEGRKGLFVAMPSRKLTDNCPSCGGKNHLRAAFCSSCGSGLDKNRAQKSEKYHVDVAHPVVSSCREKIMDAVLEAYRSDIQKEEKNAGESSIGVAGSAEDDEEERGEESDYSEDYDHEDGDDDYVGDDSTVKPRSSDHKPGEENKPVEGEKTETDESAQGADEGGEGGGGFGDGIL